MNTVEISFLDLDGKYIYGPSIVAKIRYSLLINNLDISEVCSL